MYMIYNLFYRNISVFVGFVWLGLIINIYGEDGFFIFMFIYSYYEYIGFIIYV